MFKKKFIFLIAKAKHTVERRVRIWYEQINKEDAIAILSNAFFHTLSFTLSDAIQRITMCLALRSTVSKLSVKLLTKLSLCFKELLIK